MDYRRCRSNPGSGRHVIPLRWMPRLPWLQQIEALAEDTAVVKPGPKPYISREQENHRGRLNDTVLQGDQFSA